MESYDRIKEIGRGSYGVVWLVKHKKDKKNYVMKQIDLRRTSDRDKMSAQQEAQLLKTLKHPNIVSYKESFQINGYLHIVMFYCDGGDLYTKIKEQNGRFLEETQIVEWFVQIAMAIQYMHEKNILHRDLKTQNIFLTRNKIIKVGDLGIARVLKSTNDMATTIIGTPYYMSPELFSNKPYNSKSDIWALGCCVYEMTTLKHAFNAKDMTSLVLKITAGKMPPIPQHYSTDFRNLINSMLNIDSKKRPSVNRILRDPFIKKNIMLFLERTKLKQQQQMQQEKENNFKIEPNQRVNEVSLKKESQGPTSPVSQIVPSSSPSQNQAAPHTHQRRASVTKLSNSSDSDKETKINHNNSSHTENQRNRSSSDITNDHSKPGSFENKLSGSAAKAVVKTVRISSVVENIETKKTFPLDNSMDSTLEGEEMVESDEERRDPYELTKPQFKLVAVNNYEPPEVFRPAHRKSNSGNEVNHQPKIIERRPQAIVSDKMSISPNKEIYEQQKISSSPSQQHSFLENKINSNSSSNSSTSSDNKQEVRNLDARGRRHQKLRLSQNDSLDAKPPILRKLEARSNVSEIFYNSESKSSSANSKINGQIGSNAAPSVSKSCNEIEYVKRADNPHQLQDSLKILRKINAVPNFRPFPQSKSAPDMNNNKNHKKPPSVESNNQLVPKKAQVSHSSSSSSISSSSDENDPRKKIEKVKKREKKDMDNLIDRLNSTLNAVNLKSDSEMDELKDELFDDLEEEAMQAEHTDESIDKISNLIKPRSEEFISARPRDKQPKSNFMRKFEEEEEEEEEEDESEETVKGGETIVMHAVSKQKVNEDVEDEFAELTINNLGATNHMQKRIIQLENEFLRMIGKPKLEQAFKILDSFKEEEIKAKLIRLMGQHLYEANSGKLWLLKFCKDTAKISVR